MKRAQQIVISGVGGQGVLFVTRLLAEAAIAQGMPVLTSETHGMAQRGGTVISHLKVGDFGSPLIRPKRADGLLVLQSENVAAHQGFLRPGGWMVVNGSVAGQEWPPESHLVDADTLARELGMPKAVNVVLLGFALARLDRTSNGLFCSIEDLAAVLGTLPGKRAREAMVSLKSGFARGQQQRMEE